MEQLRRVQRILDVDDGDELRKMLIGYDNQNGELLKCVDKAGNSLIHLCAMSCRLQCLNTVLSCSIRSHSPLLQLVNQSNNYGRTPLHIASFYGEESVVEILLNTQGIEIDKQTNAGCTPLYFACCRGHAEVVDRLLKAGANPNSKILTGSTPLIAATVSNSRASIMCLLNYGADVNAQNQEGVSAMHVAAESGNKDLIELMISKGGNQALEDNRGQTPADSLLLSQKKTAVDIPAAASAFRDTPTRKRHHLRTANEGGGTSDEAWAVNNHVQSTMYHSTAESASSPNSNEVSVPSTRQSSGEINTENDGQYVNMKETTLTGSRLVIENLPIRSKVSPVS